MIDYHLESDWAENAPFVDGLKRRAVEIRLAFEDFLEALGEFCVRFGIDLHGFDDWLGGQLGFVFNVGRRARQRLVLYRRLDDLVFTGRLRRPVNAAALSGDSAIFLLDGDVDLAVTDADRRPGSLRPPLVRSAVDDHLILALKIKRGSAR